MESAAGTVNEVLRCGHVSREFDSYDGSGKNHVLKDVDFSVRENEFLVLFGPGQCGKTTPVSYTHLTLPTTIRVYI